MNKLCKNLQNMVRNKTAKFVNVAGVEIDASEIYRRK